MKLECKTMVWHWDTHTHTHCIDSTKHCCPRASSCNRHILCGELQAIARPDFPTLSRHLRRAPHADMAHVALYFGVPQLRSRCECGIHSLSETRLRGDCMVYTMWCRARRKQWSALYAHTRHLFLVYACMLSILLSQMEFRPHSIYIHIRLWCGWWYRIWMHFVWPIWMFLYSSCWYVMFC